MKPYIKARTRVSADRTKCPECNGRMTVSNHKVLASGSRQIQLRCVDCGKYNTIPESVFEKSKH